MKILAELPDMAGYSIPEQSIPATEEKEAVVQRSESLRIFRSAGIDEAIARGDKSSLPHPRMSKVSGRVFQVEYQAEDGKTVQSTRHESDVDQGAIQDFDHPVNEAAEAQKQQNEAFEAQVRQKLNDQEEAKTKEINSLRQEISGLKSALKEQSTKENQALRKEIEEMKAALSQMNAGSKPSAEAPVK